MNKPRIHLIATGGTIAGTAESASEAHAYTAGTLSALELIASVPPLATLADITVEQLWNLDSKDMTPEHWVALARATQAALDRDDVDGVVITHGTDTMEESALFLDLFIRPGKPVVFTGAMRPASALSADGPMILYLAVQLACSPDARDLGVVGVMNNRIHAARNLRKAHPTALDAFTSGEAGALGSLPPVQIHRRPPPRACTWALRTSELPRVDILMVSAGSEPDLIAACIHAGAKGIVLSLPGNCSLPDRWKFAVDAAAARVPVVMSSRTGEAVHVRLAGACDPLWFGDGWLTPTQARVHLIAGLWAGRGD